MIEFSIEHDEKSVGEAYRQFWKHRYGSLRTGACVLLTVLFIPFFGLAGQPHWTLYCLVTGTVLFIFLLYTMRDSAVRMALDQFRLIEPPVFRYRLSEAGLYEKSAICHCELYWHAFAGYLELPGFFTILRKPADAGQFIAFPTGQLPEEARQFFRERLQPL